MHARCCRCRRPSRACWRREIAARKLSVREAEKLVARAGTRPAANTVRVRRTEKGRDLQRIEQELSDTLTAAVEVHVEKRTKHGEQGEIAIAFGSLNELNGLLEKLGLGAR